MSKIVEFYYDFSSPYSYIASTRIEKICQDNAAELIWKPFLLGGAFNEVGITPAVQIDLKFAYVQEDVADTAKYYGVELNFPEQFPLNSVRSMRGAFAAEEQGKLAMYSHHIFNQFWTQGTDFSKENLLADAAAGVGIDPEWFKGRINEQEIKDKLREATSAAVSRGVFGAPTIFVEDKMFWGNDRLDFVDKHLKGEL